MSAPTQKDFDAIDADQQLTTEDRASISRFPTWQDLVYNTAATVATFFAVLLLVARWGADIVSVVFLFAFIVVLFGADIGLSAGYCLGIAAGAFALHWIIVMAIMGITGKD